MSLRVLYVMDPMDRVHPDKDSTWALQVEATRRGWSNAHCLVRDLWWRNGVVGARCRPLEVRPGHAPPYALGPAQDVALGSFDCVWMRRDPPFDLEYITATWLLELAEHEVLVMNRPRALRDASEKLWALRFADLMPPSIVTADIGAIESFVHAQGGRAVGKPIERAGGEGVFLLDAGDPNFRALCELLTANGHQHAVVQAYLPAVRDTGDKRILLVDGEALGWFARIPAGGDLRANMHVGGSVQAAQLDERDRAVCDALGPHLRAAGLWFVGIDVIGGKLTEVNVTSPTGIHEANRLLGTRIEAALCDLVERLVLQRKGDRHHRAG